MSWGWMGAGVVALLLIVQTWRLDGAHTELGEVTVQRDQAENALLLLRDEARRNDTLAADLRVKLEAARKTAEARDAHVRRLIDEDKTVREWRAVPLPDAVGRVFGSARAESGRAALPNGTAVPDPTAADKK